MSKQGLDSQFPMEDIAIMGIWELVPHLSQLRVSNEECLHVVLIIEYLQFGHNSCN